MVSNEVREASESITQDQAISNCGPSNDSNPSVLNIGLLQRLLQDRCTARRNPSPKLRDWDVKYVSSDSIGKFAKLVGGVGQDQVEEKKKCDGRTP